MEKIKKYIFILLVIIIILIVTILTLISRKPKDISENDPDMGRQDTLIGDISLDTTLKRVAVRNRFFTIKNCVNRFYTYCSAMNYTANIKDVIYGNGETDASEVRKQNATSVYDVLDEEYISAKQITKDNISTKLEKINQSNVNVTDMYVSEQEKNIEIYLVEGTLRDRTEGTISNFKIIIKLDPINEAFTVLPQDYVNEKYSNMAVGQEISVIIPESIEQNAHNKCDFQIISDADYAIFLTDQLKEEMLYSSNLVYDKLDEEYKKSKFANLEEFKTYVKNNIKKYGLMNTTSYQKTITDDYTQYVCADEKNNNYYIFRVTSTMQYTLILDTYTVDLPEFLERYNSTTEQGKVALNLNKFALALNDGDYKYAYSKLADGFKANNFPTLSSFEAYVKSNLFTKNKFNYKKFGKEGETYYTYTVDITNDSGALSNTISKTFIMQLGEGTDFKLSFNK